MRAGSSPASPTILSDEGGSRSGLLRRRGDRSELHRHPVPPPRRRTNRRRTRIQRIVILAAILFVIVFALAWWAAQLPAQPQGRLVPHLPRGRLHGHRRLRRAGQAARADRRQPHQVLAQAAHRPSSTSWATEQEEIAVRADRLEPPGTLDAEQAQFATGMKVRARGLQAAARGHRRRRSARRRSSAARTHRARRLLHRSRRLLHGPRLHAVTRKVDERRRRQRRQRAHVHLLPHRQHLRPHARSSRCSRASAARPSSPASTASALVGVTRHDRLRRRPAGQGRAPSTCRPRPTSPSSSRSRTRATWPRHDVPVERHARAARTASTLKQSGTIATIAAGQTQSVDHPGLRHPERGAEQDLHPQGQGRPGARGARAHRTTAATYKFLLQLK